MQRPELYLVVSLKTRTTRTFPDAIGVAAFMKGRVLAHWAIYQLQEYLPEEGEKMIDVLQRRELVR